MDPIRIYDYLTLARACVFDAVRPLSPKQYHQAFGFGLKSIASTLAHIMISEWYYIERLAGRQVPPYDQWPIRYQSPPEFGVVESTWREQAKNTRAAIADERDWMRKITYLSFPDDDGRRFHITATAGDFFVQLALHEVHHRAQIMAMLRAFGDTAPPLHDIDYNALMYDRQELT